MTTQDQVRLTISKKDITAAKGTWYQTLKVLFSRTKKDVKDQKAYRQLAQSPDHVLKDMGITRAEINIKLNKPWWWS